MNIRTRITLQFLYISSLLLFLTSVSIYFYSSEIRKKEFYESEDKPEYELIKGHTITEVIEIIAHSKVKDYKSLTNKTIFKFMDMIDM